MEGVSPSTSSTPAEEGSKSNESLFRQPEERGRPRTQNCPINSSIGSNWPSLPSPPESSSPILPGQNVGCPSVTPTTPASPWKIQQRDPEDYEKDRVGKYAEFFVGNEILPIPEIVQKIEPRIVSLVVTDLKTRRLVGLKRESFEDILHTSGVPCQYFCRKSFATWDILMPTKEQAAKIAANNISTKFFRLQPEYMVTRRIRVTVCNVPAIITGEMLASFLSSYGRVEEVNLLRSSTCTAYGEYMFRLCLTREGFQAISEIITCRDRRMMVVIEDRRPRCWGCKQLGHIANSALRRSSQLLSKPLPQLLPQPLQRHPFERKGQKRVRFRTTPSRTKAGRRSLERRGKKETIQK